MLFAYSNMFSSGAAEGKFSGDVMVDNTPVRLDLWDPCEEGGEWNHMRALHYHQTDVFLLCYSTSRSSSLKSLADRCGWHREISHHCPRTPFFIIRVEDELILENMIESNQTDLWIPPGKGQRLADRLGAQRHLTYSVSNQEGLNSWTSRHSHGFVPTKKSGFSSIFSSTRH